MGAGVQIMAVKKCGYLRQVCAGAVSTASTLHDALTAVQAQVYSPTFQKGRIVVSQSGSGQAGTFQISGGGNDWTPDNIFGLCEELLQMLEAADPVLLPDLGTAASTEALRENLVYNIMQGNVPSGVTVTQGDFTLLYIPVFGTGLAT
jgi:hypothetical protein